jgi:3-hydroxyisobutyrate dehydrogenase-like beta-hydroxyacid dehydrogenase
MAQVSVIGLGAMGSTLAAVLADRGHRVSAWNRSALPTTREEVLSRVGVAHAATPAAAIAASVLTIMCVSDYAAAEEILAGAGVAEALAGRTLVQLTNGTTDESRGQLERLRSLGVRVLCGGIVGYPRHVGRPETVILYAGDAAAFAEHEQTLATLAGGQRFLGEDPALQNTIYTAGFCFYFAGLMGFLEGTALAAAREVAPREFAAILPALTALLADHAADAARRIAEGDYQGDQVSIDVSLAGAHRRQRALARCGLQALVSDAYATYCQEAHDAGDGDQDIASVYKRIVASQATE